MLEGGGGVVNGLNHWDLFIINLIVIYELHKVIVFDKIVVRLNRYFGNNHQSERKLKFTESSRIVEFKIINQRKCLLLEKIYTHINYKKYIY